MQGKEAVIRLIASLHIDLLERIIYVLNQECGIEVPLDFRAIRHRVPAFAETFLCIGFRQMVKLAFLYGEGIDFLERTSRIKYLSLDGFFLTGFPLLLNFVSFACSAKARNRISSM